MEFDFNDAIKKSFQIKNFVYRDMRKEEAHQMIMSLSDNPKADSFWMFTFDKETKIIYSEQPGFGQNYFTYKILKEKKTLITIELSENFSLLILFLQEPRLENQLIKIFDIEDDLLEEFFYDEPLWPIHISYDAMCSLRRMKE